MQEKNGALAVRLGIFSMFLALIVVAQMVRLRCALMLGKIYIDVVIHRAQDYGQDRRHIRQEAGTRNKLASVLMFSCGLENLQDQILSPASIADIFGN